MLVLTLLLLPILPLVLTFLLVLTLLLVLVLVFRFRLVLMLLLVLIPVLVFVLFSLIPLSLDNLHEAQPEKEAHHHAQKAPEVVAALLDIAPEILIWGAMR